MKQEEDKFTGLPENAFRELKPGEVYNPLMSPGKNYPEVNVWSVTWGIAMAILTAAGMSFIGLGIQPPQPEWGNMLSTGRDYIRGYSYLTIFPGLFIVTTVLSLNLLGDGLRDALDPKLKN